MYDTLREFRITSPQDLKEFTQAVEEIHRQSFHQTYAVGQEPETRKILQAAGIATGNQEEAGVDGPIPQENFMRFIQAALVQGKPVTADRQYRQDMPLEMECTAFLAPRREPATRPFRRDTCFQLEAIRAALETAAYLRTGDRVNYRYAHLVSTHGVLKAWDQGNNWFSIDELDPVSSTGQALDDEDAFWQRLQGYVENHPDQDLMS